MKINLNPYKGARDFYPEDKQFQNWMFDKWRNVVEKYGYLEYDAPILEPTDLYLMKGSEEIVNEQTYTFKDRGDRSVTIRTEMTPSVSRMIAGRRQELAYPARWYSIPNFWRYERMQRGRLREFWQLNVDLFGIKSDDAEIEMILIIDDILQSFNAKRSSYEIRINSRILINDMLRKLDINGHLATATIRLIDKINKLDAIEFAAKLDEITGSKTKSATIAKVLAAKSTNDLPEEFKKLPSVISIQKIIKTAFEMGINNIKFDISLMRGFDYYTDIVFEVFDINPKNNRSLVGGGRYDGLIEQFGVEAVPTIGFGMGDVTFKDFLETNKLLPELANKCEVILLLKEDSASSNATKAAQELREMDVNTAVDYSMRKLDKQLKSASKSGIRNCIFVDSSSDTAYTFKDLKTGKEEQHSLQRIVSIIKDARRN